MSVIKNLVYKALKTKTVYFHTGCPDGIIARNFIHYLLSNGKNDFDHAAYLGISPGNKLTITPNCLFVDCSPVEEQYEEFLKAGAVILDHHITNKPKNYDELDSKYPDQLMFGENAKNESGTMLAFYLTDFYMKEQGYISWHSIQNKHVATMIAMGDCWDNKNSLFERARYLGQYVALHGNEYTEIPGQQFINSAEEYGNLRRKQIERQAERVIFRSYGDLKLAFMNSYDGMSDVAEILRDSKNIDLVIGWVAQSIKIDGVQTAATVYSMRSTDKFDCSKFAKYVNIRGGGHPKAAGFTVPEVVHGIDYFTMKLINYTAITQGNYV